MIRPRILRSCCLLLLLLCINGWIASYFYTLEVGYVGKWGALLDCLPSQIGLSVEQQTASGDGWVMHAQPVEPGITYDIIRWQFAGFSGGGTTITGTSPTFFCQYGFTRVPFWFLTLLSTLLLFFVWRKTRPGNSGRAFPIESKSVLPPTIGTDPPSPPRSPP